MHVWLRAVLGALIAALVSLSLAAGSAAETQVATEGGSLFSLSSGMHAHAMSLGPDGNVWFAADQANFGSYDGKIGRVTVAGELTKFPLPDPGNGGPSGIVAGPDGNLWFVGRLQIGSISPSGVPGQLTCVESSCDLPVISLTAGREGDLWFGTDRELIGYAGGQTTMNAAMSDPGYVGRLVPRQPTTVVGPRARPMAGRLTDFRLSCQGTAGCRGVLRVDQHSPREAFAAGLLLGQRRYRLAAGESRRVRMRLALEAVDLLAKHGSIRVWVKAGKVGHPQAVRSIVLRRRAPLHSH